MGSVLTTISSIATSIGFGVGNDLYTLTGTIYIDSYYCGPAIVRRNANKYNIYTALGIQSIQLTPLSKASHRLVHRIGTETYPIKYEYGVPFKVSDGLILLQESRRKEASDISMKQYIVV